MTCEECPVSLVCLGGSVVRFTCPYCRWTNLLPLDTSILDEQNDDVYSIHNCCHEQIKALDSWVDCPHCVHDMESHVPFAGSETSVARQYQRRRYWLHYTPLRHNTWWQFVWNKLVSSYMKDKLR